MNLRTCQKFVTAVGQRVDRKKTAENVYGSLSSILHKGRKWGYFIPKVGREAIEFPAGKKPKAPAFFFDAETAARVINAATYPFRLMFLFAALCYPRIGEVTALKVSSLDFKRKVIHIDAALDYATRKEITTKSDKSCASVPMPELLERHLKDWLENRYKPNSEGYLFINSTNRPCIIISILRKRKVGQLKAGATRIWTPIGSPTLNYQERSIDNKEVGGWGAET